MKDVHANFALRIKNHVQGCHVVETCHCHEDLLTILDEYERLETLLADWYDAEQAFNESDAVYRVGTSALKFKQLLDAEAKRLAEERKKP